MVKNEKEASDVYSLILEPNKIKLHAALDFTDSNMMVGVSLPSRNGEGEETQGHYFLSKQGLINTSLNKFTDYYQTQQEIIDNRYDFNYLISKGKKQDKKGNTLYDKSVGSGDNGGVGGIDGVCKLHIYRGLPPTIHPLPTLYKYFIDFREKEQYLLLPLWIVGTYLHPIFNSFPYISLFGKQATGKSKVLKLTAKLAFNGCLTVGASLSSIYYMAEKHRASLFFDENNIFDKGKYGKRSTRAENLIPLLLVGYKKGSKVPRTDYIKGKRKLVKFSVYCPKMFASTEWDDEIFGSRTIPLIMRPAVQEIGDREPTDDKVLWTKLRTNIVDWCLDNWLEVKRVYDNLANTSKLRNRDWELIKPLVAILKVMDESLVTEFITYFEELFTNRIIDLTNNIDFKVLAVLSELPEDEYYTWDRINQMVDLNREKPAWFNAVWFGNMIKKYGVDFKKRRMAYGMEYRFRNVKDLLKRYGVLNPVDDKLQLALGSEHSGYCVECKQDDKWLKYAYDFGSVDERFVCDECGDKFVGEVKLQRGNDE